MKFVIGFVFATARVATPALAYDCASKSNVVASTEAATPATPVQTAEAPSTTVTK